MSYLTTSCPFTPDLKKMKTALSISDERTLKQYLDYLDKLQLILSIGKAGSKFKSLLRPEKIYLNNPNFIFALASSGNVDTGNLRETFVANILRGIHDLQIPNKGDFLVDDKYTFEVGGKSKGSDQLLNLKNSYIFADDIEMGVKNKIPIWTLGFLY